MSEKLQKIGIDEIFEHAALGVLRGMKAGDLSAERLLATGFSVRIDITAGGLASDRLSRVSLNPQPLPPHE